MGNGVQHLPQQTWAHQGNLSVRNGQAPVVHFAQNTPADWLLFRTHALPRGRLGAFKVACRINGWISPKKRSPAQGHGWSRGENIL
jgi:hypothetical protein